MLITACFGAVRLLSTGKGGGWGEGKRLTPPPYLGGSNRLPLHPLHPLRKGVDHHKWGLTVYPRVPNRGVLIVYPRVQAAV